MSVADKAIARGWLDITYTFALGSTKDTPPDSPLLMMDNFRSWWKMFWVDGPPCMEQRKESEPVVCLLMRGHDFSHVPFHAALMREGHCMVIHSEIDPGESYTYAG